MSSTQLQNVILKPARAAKAIDVVCKKIETDYEITMSDKPLKAGKKVRWYLDGELKIRRMNEECALVMKLCEKQTIDGADSFMSDAGGADDWASDEQGIENAASKKSKRLNRSIKKTSKQDAHQGNDDEWSSGDGNDGSGF